MKITVLGSGSSTGTPAAGGFWGACDPKEPKNNRTRASLLVQSETTNIVIDTTYDLRQHLNRVELKKIDAALLTHYHSDHINGMDDLKVSAFHNSKLVDIYGSPETMDDLMFRWSYLFKTSDNGIYVSALKQNPIQYYDSFDVGDIHVETFEQDHTTCKSMGYRFGNFAYCVDVANLDDKALNALKGIETWIVDGGAYMRETVGTHANIKRVLAWADFLKAKMTYVTVLSTHMDYKNLCDELPPHVRPAYDGLEIDMASNRR